MMNDNIKIDPKKLNDAVASFDDSRQLFERINKLQKQVKAAKPSVLELVFTSGEYEALLKEVDECNKELVILESKSWVAISLLCSDFLLVKTMGNVLVTLSTSLPPMTMLGSQLNSLRNLLQNVQVNLLEQKNKIYAQLSLFLGVLGLITGFVSLIC